MPDPETVRAISKAMAQMKSENHVFRKEGARRLGELGVVHPKITEALKQASISDPLQVVRDTAAESLVALGAAQVKPVEVIEAPEPVVRHEKPAQRVVRSQTIETPKVIQQGAVPSRVEMRMANRPEENKIVDLLERQNQLLENIQMMLTFSAEEEKERRYNFRAHVTNLDMSISAMIIFMLKWIIASIPVALIIICTYLLLGGLFTTLLAAILHH